MKKKSDGFTLLELLIVLALTGIIMSIVISMFMKGNKVFANSNTKTTLQMDAKDIQEKISDICMQANSIDYVKGNVENDEITELVLKLDQNGNEAYIKLNNNKLNINGFNIPSNVRSIKINKEIVDEAYKKNSDLYKFVSINFNIELQGKRPFGDDVIYPVKFTVTFRNR
ncbi:MAG TPA: hypothetical protein DG753_01130 [Clostridium sp.]|nr:hypothetical protein [Clostridium sp.]